jgi:hypothetical protein
VSTQREAPVKVVHCECGADVAAESDDDLVAAVEEHVRERFVTAGAETSGW